MPCRTSLCHLLLISLAFSNLSLQASDSKNTTDQENPSRTIRIGGESYRIVQMEKGPVYIKETSTSGPSEKTRGDSSRPFGPTKLSSDKKTDYFSLALSSFFDPSEHYGLGPFLAAVELSPKNMRIWSYLEKSYAKNKKNGMRDEDIELKLDSIKKKLIRYRLNENQSTYLGRLKDEWLGFNSELTIDGLGYRLNIRGLKIKKLDVLKGIPILHLDLNETNVQNLSPLKLSHLLTLDIGNTQVEDIRPICSLPLKELTISPHRIKIGLSELRKNTHLKTIGVQAQDKAWVVIYSASEFWSKVDAGDFSAN